MNQLNSIRQNDLEILDCTQDTSLCGDFDELIDIRERLSRLENQEQRLKRRLQEAMGNANSAIFLNGEISWRKSKDSIGLNTKALLEEHPHLADEYPQICIGPRRFLVKA